MRLLAMLAAFGAVAGCAGAAPGAGETDGVDWYLAQHLFRRDEIVEFHDTARRHAQIASWLAGEDHDRLETAAPASGLVLHLAGDGRFRERSHGRARIAAWYDADGVEETGPRITPFDGRVLERGGVRYLRPEFTPAERETRLKRERPHPGIALRIDDGDTLLADRIDLDGDRLLRTVSVVTDEAYLSRLTLIYRSAGSGPDAHPNAPPPGT